MPHWTQVAVMIAVIDLFWVAISITLLKILVKPAKPPTYKDTLSSPRNSGEAVDEVTNALGKAKEHAVEASLKS